MKLDNLGIILAPGARSKAYIQRLIKNKLIPSYVILMIDNKFVKFSDKFLNDKLIASIENFWYKNIISKGEKIDSFDISEPLLYTLTRNKIPYHKVYTNNCNDEKIIRLLKRKKEKFVIFTGGGILKKGILTLGKKFIHVHPGIVPHYKGSTCFYYSIINEGKCGATAFFMEEKIDVGDMIAQKEFSMPKMKDIDYLYDPYIRSDLLIDIMKDYLKSGKFKSKPQKNKGETYFIIHPILKHLAILKTRRSLDFS